MSEAIESVTNEIKKDEKIVVTFVGYSGSVYEDDRHLLNVAQAELLAYDPRRTIVNIGATTVGIGKVYELAKRLGYETIGMVSSLAKAYPSAISLHVDHVYYIEDATWGGYQGGSSAVLNPTSAAIVHVSDVVIGIGGGVIARDEMLAAKALGKKVKYIPADMNHSTALTKSGSDPIEELLLNMKCSSIKNSY